MTDPYRWYSAADLIDVIEEAKANTYWNAYHEEVDKIRAESEEPAWNPNVND